MKRLLKRPSKVYLNLHAARDVNLVYEVHIFRGIDY